METSPKPRGFRLTKWKLLIAAALVLLLYVGSFFALRQGGSVTFMVHGRLYSVNYVCFSKSRTLNYAAWWLYYPLHRQQEGSLQVFEEALMVAGKADELPRTGTRFFYVYDVDVLRQAGFRGFAEPNPTPTSSSAPSSPAPKEP